MVKEKENRTRRQKAAKAAINYIKRRKTMKKKLLILLTVLVLIIGSVFVSVGASAANEGEAPEMNYGGSTLLIENSVVLRYYTTLENVDDPYDVSVLVWNEAQANYTNGTQKWTIPFEGVTKTVSGVTYHCFDFDDMSAKMLADDFYFVIYTSTDSGEYYSKPAKTSVLFYAYSFLGKLDAAASTDTALIKLLEDMLDYGASSQDYFNYREDRLANASFYQVKLTGGTLNDGFATGLYSSGTQLVATAPTTSGGEEFSYWTDALGNVVSYDAAYELTVGSANASYTAVYGATAAVENPALTMPVFDPSSVPAYSQTTQVGYVELNGNVPFFTKNQIVDESYEYYSPLDSLGRCGTAVASLGVDLLPTEDRGDISSVKPTGWHSTASDSTIADIVPGGSLYNRSHLIAFSLAGENANVNNLITGTQSFNQVYMQIFENLVLDIMKEYQSAGQDYHVMYRVTPIFEGNNLVASGVIMEGWSVEDDGADICFNVYIYNAQPGITIDYATGDYSIYDGSENSGSEGGGSTEGGSGSEGGSTEGKTETTVNCDFSTVSGTQYANETKAFGDYVTVSTQNKGCYFNVQLRIYDSSTKDGYAVVQSDGVIKNVTINAGYSAATLHVYGSTDGVNWTIIQSVTTKSAYSNYSISVDDSLGYTYLKLDAEGAQVRVASLNLTILV